MVNVQVKELTGAEELRAATDLITHVWQAEIPPVPFSFMRALSHAGAQVLGGVIDGQLAAAAVGFLGCDADGTLLHSHVVGVGEQWRGTGVGRIIKLSQRDWCLNRGITRMAWTFDPLRVHNAYFNLTRLGATGIAYHADFYGAMNDTFNHGVPTDRVLVHWDLTRQQPAPQTPDTHPMEPVLDVGEHLRPVRRAAAHRPGNSVRIRIPTAPPTDQALALEWRLALREAMEPLLHTGYRWTHAGNDGTYMLTGTGPDPTEEREATDIRPKHRC